ncbi:MAG: hypothetical protein ABIO70_26095 [Pseudomonadota bacterium]
MAGKYVTFEELVGKVNAGEEPACQVPFGGIERPWGRPRTRTPLPLFDPTTPVEEVFSWFETNGLTPYPVVDGWDRQLAIDLLNECIAARSDSVAAVTPNPAIGVNNPSLFFEVEDPHDPTARTVRKYNYPPKVMFDLARVGVGTLRHFQEPDLAWLHLIGDDVPIAPPREMEPLLSANDWSAFGRFAYTVITCLYSGQRIIPLLFGYGGGSSVPKPHVTQGGPKFLDHAYVPVRAGWDPWYWDLGVVGFGSPAPWFQRWALNLLPEEVGYADYHRECCYRKCLGLLRFSTLVGEYLAQMALALEAFTDGAVALTDVVPAIECGNEMDTFYKLPDPASLMSAAREFGRYHALLTGPIMARGLGLRGRLGETFFWYKDRSDWGLIVQWLRETITTGIVEEVDRWHQAAYRPSADPLWAKLAQEAGWRWWTTPGAGSAGDLVHEIGFHSFTWVDSLGPRSTYRPETEFSEEAADLVSEVAQHRDVVAALLHRLEWSCCVGFQGSRPSNPDSRDEYFEGNTLLHQGGMVARRMLAAYSQQNPPTFVTWYASMGGLTAGDRFWDLYSSCGLRNVLNEGRVTAAAEPTGPIPASEGDFIFEESAWPRPARFTLRRLAWFLARASRVERVHADASCGAMVVRLVAKEGFHDPLAPGTSSLSPSWLYAYVAWLDGTTASAGGVATWVIELGPLPAGTPLFGYWDLVPLVPTVDCGSEASPPPADDHGFASAISVDWVATPQPSTVALSGTPDAPFVEIEVRPSDPTTNPAPICVLCDLEVRGMYLRPDSSSSDEAATASQEGAENAERSAPRASAQKDAWGATKR